jgi:hypothetical protein
MTWWNNDFSDRTRNRTKDVSYDTSAVLGFGSKKPKSFLPVESILLQGSDRYINFYQTTGSGGYGFRDNSGIIEYKHQGGAWTVISGSTVSTTISGNSDTSNCLLIDGSRELAGDLLPEMTGAVDTMSQRSIGSANQRYKSVYAEDVYTDEIRAYDGAGLLLTDDGSNGIFIEDGGNVGIGTTEPDANLHIYQDSPDANQTLFNIGTSDRLTRFSIDEDGDLLMNGGTFSMTYENATTDFTSSTNQSIKVSNFDVTDNNFASIGFSSTFTNGIVSMEGFTSAGIAAIFTDHTDWMNLPTDLIFWTGSSVMGTADERMRITATGNIGIGTTGPDRKLDVLDASNPQLRLTHTDGSVYTDFQTDASGILNISPSGGGVSLGDGSDLATLEVNGGITSTHSMLVDSDANAYITIDRGSLTRRATLAFYTGGLLKWGLGSVDSDIFGDGEDFYIGRSIDGSDARLVLNDTGNVGVGTNIFGTGAAKVLVLGNGIAPTSSPADSTQLWSDDLSAGDAGLHVRTETGAVHKFGSEVIIDGRLTSTATTIKVHNTSTISGISTDTWTNFNGLTVVSGECACDYLTLVSGTTITASRAGMYNLGGCVHVRNNTEFAWDDTTFLTRVYVDCNREVRCSQRGSTFRTMSFGEEVVSINGIIYLDENSYVNLQYYTDNEDVTFGSNSNFERPVSVSLWLNYIGSL